MEETPEDTKKTPEDRGEVITKISPLESKKVVAYRGWFFTIWETENTCFSEVFIQEFLINCKWFCFQLEQCPTTGRLHYQGCCYWGSVKKSSVINEAFPSSQWKKLKCAKAGKLYCSKNATRVKGPWTKGIQLPIKIKDPLEGLQPYPWQSAVLDIIREEPDDRSIYWMWENQGKTGKSALCKHLVLQHGAMVLSGTLKDLMYGIASMKEVPRVVIWDIPRAHENHCSWAGIEKVKDGLFFSSKYEGRMVCYNPPHILCFANFEPPLEALSHDRWRIFEIFDSTLVTCQGKGKENDL